MMDFTKLKSINWVGNIYQKFETICQEVDGIVNQDTIKYVENQVQTVGKSVKKISNAVQDLLPPVKHDANGVAETQKSAISGKSRKNVKQNSLDVTSKQSPTEPNVKDPVRDQLSPVFTEYDLTDQPSLPTMNTLEVAESDLSVGKINKVLATEESLVAIEKQSPTEPNVMNPVTNYPSLVSSKYHLADQPSSPTLIDTVKVPESDSSVGKVDEVLTSEGSVDVTENQLPTKLNAMDLVTNQLSVVSVKCYLPDQPSSPISVDTLKVSESNFSVGNIDGDLDIENSLYSPEKQSPMEPNLMDLVTKQLSLVGSKYYLADQPSSSAVDTLEVLESELSVENIDEVLANENSLDATENLTHTDPNVIDPCQPSLVSSKDNPAGQLSSPASRNTLEVVESDLLVPEIDDIFTNEDSAANNEETAVKVSAPILEELTSPFVAEHSTLSPHGVFSHSNHENRCADLPEVAPATPAYGLEFESKQKSTVCDKSSDETEYVSGASSTTSEVASSVVSGENAIENMQLASFSSSNAKESLWLAGYSPENSSLEAVEVAGFVSNDSNGLPSSASPLIVSGENKELGMGLSSFSSVISPESVAEGTSRTAEIKPLTVPSTKQQVQICDSVQFGAFRLSLDIGCSDESSSDSSHSPMETIDLHDKVMLEERSVGFHDKVKLEESCVIVDDSVLHAVSSRARKLRSYKVYRGLDIGSAKPSLSDRQEVPHHLVDILHPSEDYSVGRFFEDARQATRSILDNGRVPIVTGGTGLYLRWLIYGKPDVPKASLEIASEVYSELEVLQKNNDWDAAVELVVKAGDPRAQLLAANDWYRLRRSLEIIKSTGSPPSAFQVPYDSFRKQCDSSVVDANDISPSTDVAEEVKSKELDYDFICFFLSSKRVDLYKSIDYRCEDMLSGSDGILSEANWLLDSGLLPNSNSATRAIGYRQAMEYLLMCRQQGGSSAREFYNFLSEFQKASRNFAKRQLTWFRNEHIYHWLDASQPLETVLDFIYDAYHENSELLVVPESLRMKKELTSHREAAELKAYRPKNRHFIRREDCSDILDWIRETQCSNSKSELDHSLH